MMTTWEKAQEWEYNWWQDTIHNSFYEEEKQFVYARKMGLKFTPSDKTPYRIELQGKSVLDLGGGPCSLLLKAVNRGVVRVVDPLNYPEWVISRYSHKGINFINIPAEELPISLTSDEVWIYNVLQHSRDPQKICRVARNLGRLIRLFEWINTPPNIGHPHTLTAENLDSWLEGIGQTDVLTGHPCRGECYYGIFLGEKP